MHTLSIRLKYLHSREALATVVLPAVIVWSWWHKESEVEWLMRGAALALLTWILVQGTLYWYLKLRSLEGRQPLPSWFHSVFRTFKWTNLVAIGAMLAVLGIERHTIARVDLGWSAILLAGALLEQINYYHYQLMYDTRASIGHLLRNRRLRKAALHIDLERSRPRSPSIAA
jgi:hypothetical protein